MLQSGLRCVSRQCRSCRAARAVSIRRFTTNTLRMAPPALKPVEPPVSAALPADSFQLLPEASKAGANEEALFEQQVQQVREWWSSSRYKGIKRPYSPEDVVSKRGALQQSYPSSLMARKLFNLLEERSSRGEPVHTSTFCSPPNSSVFQMLLGE
jgi:isocitrate lyase